MDCKLLLIGKKSQWLIPIVMTLPIKKAPANLVPAAAVIREVQALFGIIGRKGRVGGVISFSFKALA